MAGICAHLGDNGEPLSVMALCDSGASVSEESPLALPQPERRIACAIASSTTEFMMKVRKLQGKRFNKLSRGRFEANNGLFDES